MTVRRLGDGTPDLSPTLGGEAFTEEAFTTGPRGNLFIGLRPARHQSALLRASAAPVIGRVALDVIIYAGGDNGPGGAVGPGDGDGGNNGGVNGGDGDG